MDVTLDRVGDSISLEFLLALLPFMSLFGTRLGSYSVYQWSYLSTVNVTLDTVGDSISLEFLLTLLPFMSLFGTKLGSLLSISVVLPVNSECYPGYSRRFYFLGVSSSLVTLHVFVWYKTWIFTQYISGLTCQQWMLPWIH